MVTTNLYSTNAITKTEYPYLINSPYDLTQVLRAKNNSLKVREQHWFWEKQIEK